jgi:cytochrome c biogenesis protein CcmG/thiol:disulfide interchange protein DsbE
MKRGFQIAGAIAVLAVIVVGVVLGSRFGSDPLDVESPLIGQPLPRLRLASVDGGEFDSQALLGAPSVINVWASWCFPCRAEHEVLLSAAEDYPGVSFVGLVYQDRLSNVEKFLDEFGTGYPNVLDDDARAAIELGVFGVPETFFVDAEGIIVAKVQGPVTRSIMESTLNAVILGQQPGTQNVGTVQLTE